MVSRDHAKVLPPILHGNTLINAGDMVDVESRKLYCLPFSSSQQRSQVSGLGEDTELRQNFDKMGKGA